jgi:hypothetical protein
MGEFGYRHLSQRQYAVGVDLVPVRENVGCLMATPEKALMDKLVVYVPELGSIEECKTCLFEDLRIDPNRFSKLRLGLFRSIRAAYRRPVCDAVVTILEEIK